MSIKQKKLLNNKLVNFFKYKAIALFTIVLILNNHLTVRAEAEGGETSESMPWKFGPKFGIGLNNMGGESEAKKIYANDKGELKKRLLNFEGGAFVEYKFHELLSGGLSLTYADKAFKIVEKEKKDKSYHDVKIGYFQVSPGAQFYFGSLLGMPEPHHELSFFLEVPMQILMRKSYKEFEDGKESETAIYKEFKKSMGEKGFTKFVLGVHTGFGYKSFFGLGIQLGLNFNFMPALDLKKAIEASPLIKGAVTRAGTVNLDETDLVKVSKKSTMNSFFTFTLSYDIGKAIWS